MRTSFSYCRFRLLFRFLDFSPVTYPNLIRIYPRPACGQVLNGYSPTNPVPSPVNRIGRRSRTREEDPEGLGLDHTVAEGARGGVYRVRVGRVGDVIYPPSLPAKSFVAEPDGAVGEYLGIVSPVRVAPPAVVNRVPGPAQVLLLKFEELPSTNRFIHSPAQEEQTT